MPRNSLLCTWWLTGFIRKDSGTSKASSTSDRLIVSSKPGLTLAIEPWFARTTDKIVYDPDGWTIRSADGSRTAHSEHTIAVTEGDPLILTASNHLAARQA